MWTCQRCGRVNDDTFNVCSQCSAQRSAGRFGSGAAPITDGVRGKADPSAPYIKMAQPPAQMQQAVPPIQTAPAALRTEYAPPDPGPCHAGALTMFIGAVLGVTLPLLCILLAWKQYDRLSKSLLGLFFSPEKDINPVISMILYLFLSLIAALTVSLPGLLTISKGKMLRRLERIEKML